MMSACGHSIDGWAIASLIKQCEMHGGIEYIKTINDLTICRDGFVVVPIRATE